MINQEIALK